MNKNLFTATIGTLLIASMALLPAPAIAKTKSPAAAAGAATPAATDKTTKFPFHGKLSAVDVAAKTFTLEGKTPRVFHATDQTKITKNGESAKLTDAKVGDDVGGYTEKAPDGTLTALSVRFGPKPEKAGAAAAPAAASAASAAAPAATTESTATPAAATPKPKVKRIKKSTTPAASTPPATPATPAAPATTPAPAAQ